ncbi:MAG TPA: TolC family protein [Kiritimatiellia bacterium]|nr:TolC family protein [Kiritimatiellia bacterium]
MLRVLMILLVASTVARADPDVRGISLEDAIAMALTRNRDIAAQELELNGRVLTAEQARYRFAFNLRPIASAAIQSSADIARYGVIGSQRLPFGPEIEAGIRAEESNFDNAERRRSGIGHVELRQPVFRDWGSLVNQESIERADSRVTAGRRLLELRKNDLVVQVVETSQGLLRLQRLIEDEKRTIERYDRLLRLTRAREKQGRSTRVDTLRVAFLKGQSESRLASTAEQLRSLQSDFASLLGGGPDELWMPEESEDLRWSRPDRDFAINLALSNRLDFAQALQDEVDAARGVRVATKRLQPALSLVARYERFGVGPDWGSAWGFDDDNWSIALGADSDFFLRDERVGVAQAGLDRQTAAIRVDDMDAMIRRQVDQSLSAHRRAEAEMEIAERNVELAAQRAVLARRLFEKGRVDNTAASDAEAELLDARTKLLNARAEAVVAGYRLLRTMGMLMESPDDLKPPAVRRI